MNDIFLDLNENPVEKPSDRISKERTSIYGVLIESDKILLVKSRDIDFWELPGGGLEKDEEDLSTLKREMLEEANCDVLTFGKCLGETHGNFYANDLDEYYRNTCKYYRISKWDFVDKKLDMEVEEYKMLNIKDLNFTNIRSYHREIIKKEIIGIMIKPSRAKVGELSHMAYS